VQNKEASTIANAIISQWICRFGIPDQIFSDGGKEFANKLLTNICTFLKIAKNKTTPAHPQCNAQVEIVNKTIKKYLTTMTDDALDWEPLIPTLAFAYNTTKHNTTGYSPAHLMLGYQPRYTTNDTLPDNHNDTTDGLLRHLFLNRQVATKTALQRSQEYKDRHDANKQSSIISPGHFVFLNYRLFLNTNEKIEDKWEGPYLVTKVFPNGTLDLIRKGRSIRVNKNRVKPEFDYTQCDDFSTCDIPTLPAPSFTPSQGATQQQDPISQNSEIPSAPPIQKRGRPRKVTPLPSPDTQMLPPQVAPTNENNDNSDSVTDNALPSDAPIAINTRYGNHPMVLRQRPNRTIISHLKMTPYN
jgi:hypothetical protein